ncbi:hypothetical protein SAMN05428961_10221 [Paenibacillus sp. OK060]|uniref:hypothetical protein n=1 Tax=Paenibacillus sp. OK060 TaxID=1881034 RepID=UPI00088DC828|nr:hypothetical protein [Paenibacillus sp. OK060]SDK41747.1 hypothetical protein SAMN05428961_10221 [Paenibacillus sp. OK060]
MKMYSKGALISGFVVFIISVSGGLIVSQNTSAKNTINPSHITPIDYSENEHGLTFGTIEESNSFEILPDLIYAGSVNGIKGYLLKKDYLGEPGDVPLYDVYGKTIIGSFHISPMNMNYPKNKKGQTYGSSADATSPETEPELISAIGEDGTSGYVLKKDLDGALPKSPEEAIAIQNSRSPEGRDIPLFDVDGVTVIGVFHVGGK